MPISQPSFRRLAGSLVAASLCVASVSVVLATPTVTLAQGRRGQGDHAAEAFVQTEANRALNILNDSSISTAAKKAAFHTFVDQVADVPRITSFVLGQYRRTVTPAQYAAFARAFRVYADSVYETRLGEYKGQRLNVTGSVVYRPGDVVVQSRVTGGGQAPALVNWRVQRGSDGRYRVVDVQVAGVWLAVTEQQDFVSTITNNHGDVSVLISQLKSKS